MNAFPWHWQDPHRTGSNKAQIGWPFIWDTANSKTAGSYGVSPVHDNNSLTSLTGDRHNQSLPAGASQRFSRVAFIEVHPLWWMNPTLSSANAVVSFVGKILGGVWESAKRKKKMVMAEFDKDGYFGEKK
ncbi:pantothenate synthetase [Sesbania bispinosa]|nr:pantothenate synthetase [Sesbania bispinosa]